MDTSTPSECPGQTAVALSSKLLVGTAKVRLCDLDWSHCSRQFDTEIKTYLKRTFDNDGCRREDPRTNVDVIISQDKLRDVLESSKCTLEEIKESSRIRNPRLLTLPRSEKLQCIHGQHRLAAAAEFLPRSKEEQWWIVNLYSYSRRDANVSKVIQYQGEYFDHQTRFSDGEVYKKIRKYSYDKSNIAKWKGRLSKSKLTGLEALLRHEDITKALDDLLVFPGMLDGLELGNAQKTMALRCDEEILRYLRHIKDCWDEITLKDREIQKQVTIETIQLLQLRAPGASAVDRAYISQIFEGDTILPSVSSRKRRAVRDAILQLDVIIPSIKSLHENVKYLALGSMVLKDKVFDRNIRTTIQQKAFSKWTPSSTLPVEVQEHHTIQYRNLKEKDKWDLTYKQLWIRVLRNFPQLSGIPPRKEAGGEATVGRSVFEESNYEEKSPMVEQELLDFVLSLGIKTRKILAASSQDPKLETLYNCVSKIYSTKPQTWRRSKAEEMLNFLQNQPETESMKTPLVELRFSSLDGESLERRWGRPFRNAHISTKDSLYLLNLIDRQLGEIDSMPTALYVQRDFFNAFFGKTSSSVFENGRGHIQERVRNTNSEDEVRTDPGLDQEDNISAIPQSQPEESTRTEYREDIVPSREDDPMNIDNLQEQLPGDFSMGNSVPPQINTAIFESHSLFQSGTEAVAEQVRPLTAATDEILQQNSHQNMELFVLAESMPQLAVTSTVVGSSQETNSMVQIENPFTQLERRTPIQSIYNLPASINSLDGRDISVVESLSDSSLVRVPSPVQDLGQATSQESRTFAQSTSGPRTTFDIPTDPESLNREIQQTTSPQEGSRTPIQSLYNLPATTVLSTTFAAEVEETENSVGPGSIRTPRGSLHDPLIKTILPVNLDAHEEQTRNLHELRTPIQSVYNLPATVDIPSTTQTTSQTIVTRDRPRTVIQSIYNLPATTNTVHNIVSANMEGLDDSSPQEWLRTPLQATYNLPATVQSFHTDFDSSETYFNMPDSAIQLHENTPQPEMTKAVQMTSQTRGDLPAMRPIVPSITTYAKRARLKNRIRKAHPYQFLEYDGEILVSKNVYKLEDYLKLHEQWHLFGGTSVNQGFIISLNKRAWYIQKYSTWTFVFVPRKYGEVWKREGAKLMRSFVSSRKKNSQESISPLSVSWNSLADSSQQLNPSLISLGQGNLQELDKIQASLHGQPDEQILSHPIQVASADQLSDTENRNTYGPGALLGTFINPVRRYAGNSLLTAERDLRDTVKPKLGSSVIAFLLYKSPDEWELSELSRRFVPQILKEMATYYYAFTFERDRESLSEIGMDIRLAEKAEAFNLWIVPKGICVQFLKHRDRSFNHHFLEGPAGAFESGTGQEVGESGLFEDSEPDFPESNLHPEILMSPRLDRVGKEIDTPLASADRDDDLAANLPLSTSHNITEPMPKSMPGPGRNDIAKANKANSETSPRATMQAGIELVVTTDLGSENNITGSSVSVDQAEDPEGGTKDANVPQEAMARKRRHSAIEQEDIIKIRDIFEDVIRKPKKTKLHNINLDNLSRKRTHSDIEQEDVIKIRDIVEDVIRRPKRAKLSSAADRDEIAELQDVLDEVLRGYQISKTPQDRNNEESAAEDFEIVE